MKRALPPITLATDYPINRVEDLVSREDREGIAEFLSIRFTERYVTPVLPPSSNPFVKAAVTCLLLETLQAFRAGVGRTPEGQSGSFFRDSLDAHEGYEELAFYERSAADELSSRRAWLKAENNRRKNNGLPRLNLRARDDTLYGNVRSAIMHQGETTGGWRLTKRVTAFDWDERLLNVHWFHREAAGALADYLQSLTDDQAPADPWPSCKKKLIYTITHAKKASEKAGDEA